MYVYIVYELAQPCNGQPCVFLSRMLVQQSDHPSNSAFSLDTVHYIVRVKVFGVDFILFWKQSRSFACTGCWDDDGVMLDMWRAFVLHTPSYLAFCNDSGVPYIHLVLSGSSVALLHRPFPKEYAAALQCGYESFTALYRDTFGCDAPLYTSGRVPRLALWQPALRSQIESYTIRFKTLQARFRKRRPSSVSVF